MAAQRPARVAGRSAAIAAWKESRQRHCVAGRSGWAPKRRRRHGQSASIPHVFAPLALRASLASGGKPWGLSPPRGAWRP